MNYLQGNRPGLYVRLLLYERLCEHMAEIDSTCQEK